MTIRLHGCRPVLIEWIGPAVVMVTFASDDVGETGLLHQLYSGRTLIGRTVGTEKYVLGPLEPVDPPGPLSVVSVSPSLADTDHGSLLDKYLPYNRYRLTWSHDNSGGVDHFDIYGSPAAGEPVDTTTPIAQVPAHSGSASYSYRLPPLAGSGVWTFQVTPRDATAPDGNAGALASQQVTALVYPSDVTVTNGRRFTVSVAGGVLTPSFQY